MADRHRSGSRGTKDWAGVVIPETTIGTTQAIIATLVDAEPITLLRSRGELMFAAIPDAAGDDDVIGVGLIVVSDASAGVGGASVPGPINDLSAPWIWHTFVPLLASGAAVDGASIGENARVVIDSKAMRKIGLAESLILVVEASTGTFASITVTGGLRALALHS